MRDFDCLRALTRLNWSGTPNTGKQEEGPTANMSSPAKNQKPEQISRDLIDAKLAEAGWHVQDKDKINFNAGPGIAVREYLTDIGPADYVLFVERHAVGVIKENPADWGHKLTTVE